MGTYTVYLNLYEPTPPAGLTPGEVGWGNLENSNAVIVDNWVRNHISAPGAPAPVADPHSVYETSTESQAKVDTHAGSPTHVGAVNPSALHLSRVSGADSNDGRWDRPKQVLATAVAALPTDGVRRTGQVLWRGGPLFDATGAPATFPGSAEYQLTQAEQTLQGIGIEIKGSGSNKERGGQQWGTSQLQVTNLLMADPSVGSWAGSTALIGISGTSILLERFAIRNDPATGIPAIQLKDVGAQSARNSRFRDIMISGGVIGMQFLSEDNDQVLCEDLWICYCTDAGVHFKQGTTTPNLVQFLRSTFRWNGSTLGGITPTGANVRIEAAFSPWLNGNAIAFEMCKWFGGSYIVDFVGAHSVGFYNNQFEPSSIGSDGNPIKDRSAFRFRNAIGAGAGSPDGFNWDILFDEACYYHTTPDTTTWTADGRPAWFDVASTTGLTIEQAQFLMIISRLNAGHPLVRLQSTTMNNELDLSNVADSAGRSTMPTDPSVLVNDLGVANQVSWLNPVGV